LFRPPRSQAQETAKKTLSGSMALPSEVFSDSERAILEFLAKNGSAGRSTVEKTFGLPRTTANYQLKKLVDGKLIRKIGAGKNTRYAAYGSTDGK